MASGYWQRFTHNRVGRRRLLASTGAAAAVAAFLAACGGDEDTPAATAGSTGGATGGSTGGSTGGGSTGGTGGATGGSTGGSTGATGPTATHELLTGPVDESSKAVHGGVMAYPSRQLTSLDPIGSSAIGINYRMYSTLWTKKAGYLEPYSGEMIGDLAESWEVSGDQLQVTVKITPKAHFAGPESSSLNGREVNAHDVEYTWNRFKTEGAIRTEVVNDENPEAPIVSMTATDDRTLVIKLAKPDATLFGLLAQQRAGNFYILPVEADDVDIKNVSIGSGPWVMDRWEPGVGHYLKKNPGYNQDYRGEDLPYLDKLDMPELQEQALALAQFRAGNTQFFGSYIAQDQVLPLKKDVPELQMYLQDPITTSMRLIMGKAPGSPFIDERVRQAAMYVMDRELMIETLGNTAAFEAEGLPVTKTFDTSMAVNQPGFWFLDPSSSEFGPNAKYFEYNPEEAKTLLSAAGFSDGLDTTMIATFGYNPGILAKMDVVLAVFGGGQGGPIRYTIQELDYHTEWSPVVRFGKGMHDGVAMLQDVDTPDPALYMYIRYNPSGGVFQGGDDTMTELTTKAKAEFDDDARRELIYEMQRHEAKAVNFPFSHGGASQFHLYWPALRGFDVWQGSNAGLAEVALWRDPNQAPKA